VGEGEGDVNGGLHGLPAPSHPHTAIPVSSSFNVTGEAKWRGREGRRAHGTWCRWTTR
jgi:hypothetical protein